MWLLLVEEHVPRARYYSLQICSPSTNLVVANHLLPVNQLTFLPRRKSQPVRAGHGEGLCDSLQTFSSELWNSPGTSPGCELEKSQDHETADLSLLTRLSVELTPLAPQEPEAVATGT